jgi:hypothetical protein
MVLARHLEPQQDHKVGPSRVQQPVGDATVKRTLVPSFIADVKKAGGVADIGYGLDDCLHGCIVSSTSRIFSAVGQRRRR